MPPTTDNPDLIEQHFKVVKQDPTDKCKTYECAYCQKQYAMNVTRMKLHLRACAKCPSDVHKTLKIKRHKHTITKAIIAKIKEDTNILGSFRFESSDNDSAEPDQLPPSQTSFARLLRENEINEYLAQSAKKPRLHSTPQPSEETNESVSLVYGSYTQLATQPNDKCTTYECNYCQKKYAKNVTRMKEHLISCSKCPEDIQETLRIRRRVLSSDNVYKSFQDLSSELQESSNLTEILNPTRKLSKKETNIIWMSLARACYASAMSFDFVDNPYWVACFKRIKPNFVLPNREQLSNTLLDNEYINVKKLIQERLTTSTSLCLQIYGWSGARSDTNATNVVVITPSGPILYKAVCGGPSTHTSKYLIQLLTDLFDKVGAEKFTSIVTDNAKCIDKISTFIKAKYPKAAIATYLCYSVAFTQLIECICDIDVFKNVISISTTIIRKIKASAALSHTFANIRSSVATLSTPYTQPPLVLPNRAERISVVNCLENLIANERNLKTLALKEEANSVLGNSIEHIIDEDYWTNVKALLELLKPIADTIRLVETNKDTLSIVLGLVRTIRKHLTAHVPALASKLNFDKTIIFESFERNRLASVSPVHYAANLLDPRTRANALTDDEIIEGISYISFRANAMHTNRNEVISDLAFYRTKQGLWAKQFVWEALEATAADENELTAVSWWNGICSSSPLAKIASAVLQCVTSTIRTEKFLNTYTPAHAKRLNGLSNTRAAKLVYITQNLRLLNDNMTPVRVSGAEDAAANYDFNDDDDDSNNSHNSQLSANHQEIVLDLSDSGEENDNFAYAEQADIALSPSNVAAIDYEEESDYSVYVYSDIESIDE